MMEYIITFNTHFEALTCLRFFEKLKTEIEMQAKLIPVPRSLSSSCGTALKIHCQESTDFIFEKLSTLEYEKIFSVSKDEKYSELKK